MDNRRIDKSKRIEDCIMKFYDEFLQSVLSIPNVMPNVAARSLIEMMPKLITLANEHNYSGGISGPGTERQTSFYTNKIPVILWVSLENTSPVVTSIIKRMHNGDNVSIDEVNYLYKELLHDLSHITLKSLK